MSCCPVLRVDLEQQPRARFGQAFPGIAGKLALLVGIQLVGETANHTTGFEPLRRHHNGVKHIARRDNQQGNRLALALRQSDHAGEQFLLVMIEDFAGVNAGAPAETVFSVIEAGGHHHDFLLGGIGFVQNVAQEGEIPRITHRDQNVSRFCLQSGEAEIAIRLHPELVELLGFAVPRDLFPVFGPGEQSKEDSAEDDAGNRGFIFGEQVDQRGHQQDAGDQHQTDGKFALAELEVHRYPPLAVAWFLVAQHRDRQTL